MKILVRKWNEEESRLEYVWEQVSKKPHSVRNNKEFYTISGNVYTEQEVLKILRDSRKSFNFCTNCGKLVKPGDEEKHFAEKEKNINCFDCHSVYMDPTGRYKKRKWKLQKDGSYMRTIKEEIRLSCGASYFKRDIEEVKKNKDRSCPYFRCRSYGIKSFDETTFMRYPKMHEIFATEKSLIDNKFTLKKMYTNSHTRIYVHKRLKNLEAKVDDNGLVMYFTYYYRGSSYEFVYSKTYDKFFARWSSGYKSLVFNFAETTNNNIQSVIRKVYEN